MITVNNTDHPFSPRMTISSLLEEKNFVFPLLVVKLNGLVVEDADFADTAVSDGDDVTVMHLLAGG